MTKERLREYLPLAAELKSIERQLEALEADVYSVKALTIGGAQVCGKKGAATGDFSGVLIKLIDLRAHYERKWDALIDLRTEIENAIEALPNIARAIIRAKYVDGLTWEEVAWEVGYSTRQIQRIHAEIFKDVAQCRPEI